MRSNYEEGSETGNHSPLELECNHCHGFGDDDDGAPCLNCEGYGTVLVE